MLHCRYTLRNAEYRLCLERNFDTDEDSKSEVLIPNIPPGQDELHDSEKISQNALSEIPDLGQITPEVQQYILELQSRLFSARKVKYVNHCNKVRVPVHYYCILDRSIINSS